MMPGSLHVPPNVLLDWNSTFGDRHFGAFSCVGGEWAEMGRVCIFVAETGSRFSNPGTR